MNKELYGYHKIFNNDFKEVRKALNGKFITGGIYVAVPYLKHMHNDIERLHDKMDRFLYWLLGGLGAIVLALLTTSL